jgi:RHO1 GDP-GTP exchange protein 1/2
VLIASRADVRDLKLVQRLFAEPLRNADPPIIKKDRLRGFIKVVFWNMDEILAYHQRMLKSLFARQREQHPLIHSISDIILESASILLQSPF